MSRPSAAGARRGRRCSGGCRRAGRREGRTRWRRPSGWVTVPSFSAWVSSGKTTSAFAVVAFSSIEKVTTKSAAVSASSQAGVSGKSRSGSTPNRIRPLSSPDSSAARISSVSTCPAAVSAETGAGVGEAAGLAQAAGVGDVRDFQQAALLGAGDVEWPRRRRAAPRRLLLAGDPLAPDDDDAARRRAGSRRPGWRRSRRRRARSPARRRSGRPRPGRSGRSPRRRRRAAVGRSVATPAWRRCGGSPCGCAGRGSASCAAGRCRARGSRRPRRCRGPWRRSPARRGGRSASRPRAAARGASRRAASRAPRAAAAAPGSPPRWRRRRRSRDSEAVVLSGPSPLLSGEDHPASARFGTQPSAPSRAPPPATAPPFSRGPSTRSRRVEHLEAVAAAVAEPAVVDLVVVAGEHPFHLLVADREADVALARAERADRARVLDVPGPGAEAVGVVGQRPDRADVGDVAVERGHVGAVVEGADEGAVAALEQLQLGVLGDLLAEADAAVAEDAALAVDRDQRREFDRLLEVALFVDHPGIARAPALA